MMGVGVCGVGLAPGLTVALGLVVVEWLGGLAAGDIRVPQGFPTTGGRASAG